MRRTDTGGIVRGGPFPCFTSTQRFDANVPPHIQGVSIAGDGRLVGLAGRRIVNPALVGMVSILQFEASPHLQLANRLRSQRRVWVVSIDDAGRLLRDRQDRDTNPGSAGLNVQDRTSVRRPIPQNTLGRRSRGGILSGCAQSGDCKNSDKERAVHA